MATLQKRVIIMCNLAENYILTGVPWRGQESVGCAERANRLRGDQKVGLQQEDPKAWRRRRVGGAEQGVNGPESHSARGRENPAVVLGAST